MASSSTRLDYAVATDPGSLYTSVDGDSPSRATLTFTAQNRDEDAVTIRKIQIYLEETGSNQQDTVNLILAGSEAGIDAPSPVQGPGGSSWTVTSQGGVITIAPEPAGTAVTFQEGDALVFAVQGVTIRAGGTGTATLEVYELSDKGKGQAFIEVPIAQSTLKVTLTVVAANGTSEIEPGEQATLQWQATDATSGTLTIPDGTPSSIDLPSSTYNLALESGSLTVEPIRFETTYTLTCQGRGPNIEAQATISVVEVDLSDIAVTPDFTVGKGRTALLSWGSKADTCQLSSHAGTAIKAATLTSGGVSVPVSVPNDQYPKGYPVTVQEDITYRLTGYKTLKSGRKISSSKEIPLSVAPVTLNAFTAVPPTPVAAGAGIVIDPGDAVTLTWDTSYATPDSISIQAAGADGRTTTIGSRLNCASDATNPLVHKPTGTTVYTLTCDGLGGPLTAVSKVYVGQPMPGLDVLGRGFNVFADGSDDLTKGLRSATLLAFSAAAPQPNDGKSYAGGYWIDPTSDAAYLLPAGSRLVPRDGEPVRSSGRQFSTGQQAADYYAGCAALDAGTGAFSMAAPAREAAAQGYENIYNIAERTTAYRSLELDPAFVANPQPHGPALDAQFKKDLLALPSGFDASAGKTVDAFRRFFATYGTHVVSSVTFGIKLTWLLSTPRTAQLAAEVTTDASIQENMDRIVNGDVFGFGVEGEGAQPTFTTAGGDPSLARQLTAQPFGDEKKGGFYPTWAASGPRNATRVAYALRGIWGLAGSAAQAIEEAYGYFALPSSVVPLHWYVDPKNGDNFYTTWENPETTDGMQYQSVLCYVLPQNTQFTARSLKFNRFVGNRPPNTGLHYYTTHPQPDTQGFAPEPSYYSFIPNFDVPRVLRLYLYSKVGTPGWLLSTSQTVGSNYKPDGELVAYVFANAPADPFAGAPR